MEKERLLWERINEYRKSINDGKIAKKLLQKDILFETIKLFEEIIPYLGIYKSIIDEIKNYLFGAIFDEYLTADRTKENRNECYIGKVTFFELSRKLEKELIKQNFEFDQEKADLEEKLDKEVQKNEELSMKLSESIANIEKLQSKIEENNEEIDQLKDDIQQKEDFQKELCLEKDDIIETMNTKHQRLKRQLENGRDKIEWLVHFEKGYRELDKKFSQVAKEDDEDAFDENEDKRILQNDDKENSKTLSMLMDDILVLENVLLTDYQQQQEDLKEALLDQWKMMNSTDESNEIEMEISKRIGKLTGHFNKTKTFFQKNFKKILTERNEYVSRKERIKIHASTPSSGKKIDFIPELKEIEQMYTLDESSLNIYSAKLHYSTNNGKTFYDSPDTKYCQKCAIKTVICPHNIKSHQKIISLPPNCTHIMVERPPLMVQKINDYGDDQEEVENSKKHNFRFRKSIFTTDFEEFLSFEELLKGFSPRKHARDLDEKQILSLFEDFWGEILLEDDTEVDMDNAITCREKLRIFFVKRLKLRRPSELALYDFLTNMLNQVANNSLLILFCHVLLGNMDSSLMRYMFFLTECIQNADVSNEEAFRFFIETIYPFLEEDEIDNIVLSFISYSENRFLKNIVYDFILMTLLRGKDPRILKIEIDASDLQTQFERAFTMKEYGVFLETVCYLPNKKLSERLFRELLMIYPDPDNYKVAPMKIICQLVGLISFIEKFENIKRKLIEYKETKKSKNKNETLDVNDLRWSFNRMKSIAEIVKEI